VDADLLGYDLNILMMFAAVFAALFAEMCCSGGIEAEDNLLFAVNNLATVDMRGNLAAVVVAAVMVVVCSMFEWVYVAELLGGNRFVVVGAVAALLENCTNTRMGCHY
jgi:hypothetical protein